MSGVPKEKAGIPVDEQFGAAIIRNARGSGALEMNRYGTSEQASTW